MSKRTFALDMPSPMLPGDTAPESAPHEARVKFRVSGTDDFLLIDPHAVVMKGAYVREVNEDEPEFMDFAKAVRANQDIGQPIGVRMEGDLMDPEYVLVYGMRRLMAARAAGLAKVPARNFGPDMSESEAFLLQVVENEARKDPTPGETAHGFAVLRSFGERQVDIARRVGRSESYISYMCKVGEAMAELDDDTRHLLYGEEVLHVRDCQDIAKIRDPLERAEALRGLVQGRAVPVAATSRGPKSPFFTRRHHKNPGRTFRITWSEDDLRGPEAEGFISEVESFLEAELQALRKRKAELGS